MNHNIDHAKENGLCIPRSLWHGQCCDSPALLLQAVHQKWQTQPQAPCNAVAMSALLMLACSSKQAMIAWHFRIAWPLQAQHLPVSPSWIVRMWVLLACRLRTSSSTAAPTRTYRMRMSTPTTSRWFSMTMVPRPQPQVGCV